MAFDCQGTRVGAVTNKVLLCSRLTVTGIDMCVPHFLCVGSKYIDLNNSFEIPGELSE